MRGEVSPWNGETPPDVVFRGRVPPNTSVTGAATINWTEDTDTHNAYGGGTGIFTAPIAGLYLVALSWKPSTALAISMIALVNGTGVITTPGSTATAFTGMAATFLLPLAAGDQLTIQSNGTFTTTNDATYNTWCHIARVA